MTSARLLQRLSLELTRQTIHMPLQTYSSKSCGGADGQQSAATKAEKKIKIVKVTRSDSEKDAAAAKEPKKPFEQRFVTSAGVIRKEIQRTIQIESESKSRPDSKLYKVHELYQHNPWSFYDIESSLAPHRCHPQPSSKKKKKGPF